jgi:hypothetical protein
VTLFFYHRDTEAQRRARTDIRFKGDKLVLTGGALFIGNGSLYTCWEKSTARLPEFIDS